LLSIDIKVDDTYETVTYRPQWSYNSGISDYGDALATKRTNGGASAGTGWAIIIGLALLVGILAWPLFVFHRHWDTTEAVSCSTDSSGDSCTFDYNTGDFSGTWTKTTTHTAISATGWIVEAVWVGVLAGGVLLLGAVGSAEKKKKGAVSSSGKKGAASSGQVAPQAPRRHPTGYDVVDPSFSTSRRNNSTLNADQVVRFSALDETSRQLLLRAQRAIKGVLTCKVYAENQLQQAVTEPTLRRHEWAIAVNLREITSLRAEQAKMRKSRAVESPGPLTKAVLDAQQGALHQKLKAVESLVKALENYASHVKAADLARLDWEAAAELAKLNPRFSNLVAGTAADELHLQEVHDMTDEATTFHDSLLRANLAAEPLLLPDVIAEPNEKL
jgi:hypothetical protein